MTKWQPIETAPKDYEDVLVIDEDGYILIAHRDDFEDNSFNSLMTKYYFYLPCDGPEYVKFYPSHWMPLPEPPEND